MLVKRHRWSIDVVTRQSLPGSRYPAPLRAIDPTSRLFTTLYNGILVALNRSTGAIVYQRQLPTSANAPIAVFGNTVLVPAGGPKTLSSSGGHPQLVAYTVR